MDYKRAKFDFAKNLLALRHKHGYTREQLSELIGISLGHLQLVENGNRNLSFQYVIEVCNIFGVTPNQLYGLEELEGVTCDSIK